MISYNCNHIAISKEYFCSNNILLLLKKFLKEILRYTQSTSHVSFTFFASILYIKYLNSTGINTCIRVMHMFKKRIWFHLHWNVIIYMKFSWCWCWNSRWLYATCKSQKCLPFSRIILCTRVLYFYPLYKMQSFCKFFPSLLMKTASVQCVCLDCLLTLAQLEKWCSKYRIHSASKKMSKVEDFVCMALVIKFRYTQGHEITKGQFRFYSHSKEVPSKWRGLILICYVHKAWRTSMLLFIFLIRSSVCCIHSG